MRALIIAAATLAVATPLPAFAQDVEGDFEEPRLSEKLADPALQQGIAESVAVMTEVMLDIPLAPIMEAMAEAVGEDPGKVDPDMTLRKVSPGADRLPSEVADKLPRAMGAMAGMAGGMEKMMPALRQMAERMKDVMADVDLPPPPARR